MKLESKKSLASRALNISKERIAFNIARLSEIKEAITKQDIKDLTLSGAISIKGTKGRKKTKKRKTRRRSGSIKKKVNTRKQDYVKLTRKLRTFLRNLKNRMKLTREDFVELRKLIRAKEFRSLAHMKEKIKQMKEKE
jgi:large subunit ribosomal protein L19e